METSIYLQPVIAEVRNLNMRIKADFPKLNKNCTLAEYEKEMHSYDTETVLVCEVITFNHKEFEYFCDNLMTGFDWLNGRGGTCSDYETDLTADQLFSNPEELEKYKDQVYVLGLLCVDGETGKTIVVNPEGYNYARYVGFPGTYHLPELQEAEPEQTEPEPAVEIVVPDRKPDFVVEDIVSKKSKRHGVEYGGKNSYGVFHAEIWKNEAIRIHGAVTNQGTTPKIFNRVFNLDDEVEYDSYNFVYTGPILKIGQKTVTIDKGSGYSKNVMLDLHTFILKNWDLDLESISKRNIEVSYSI